MDQKKFIYYLGKTLLAQLEAISGFSGGISSKFNLNDFWIEKHEKH